MNEVKIASEQCKGCGLCVETCKRRCLVIGPAINKIGYRHVEFVQKKCTACGLCYYVCPEPGAITVISDQDEKREKPSDGKK